MQPFQTLWQATGRLSHTLSRLLKELFKGRPQPGPSSPPLDHLADDDLLAIFSHFPVGELLHRKALSVRLEGLQAQACRARSDINLLIGHGAGHLRSSHMLPELAPFNTLTLGVLTLSDADRIVEQMPRVCRLCLVLPRIQEEEIVATVRLLRSWSGSLHQLDICLAYSEGRPPRPDALISQCLLRLLVSINCLSHLETLSFKLSGYLFSEDAPEQSLYLPVLAHLQMFIFASNDTADCLVDSLVHYLRDPAKVSKIDIANFCTQVAAQRLLQMEPAIAKAFVKLNEHHNWRPTYQQLGRFVDHFGGIRQISLSLPGYGNHYNLPALVRGLRSLKGLERVNLLFISVQQEIDAAQGQLEHFFNELPQVTALMVVFLDLVSHLDPAALHLGRYFPAIKGMAIHLAIEECALCGQFGPLQGRQDRPEHAARAEACRQATRALIRRRFPLLQRVGVNMF